MDSANVVKGTFKLTSVFHGEQQKADLSMPSGTIVPFPDYMTRKLANALPGTGVIALVGAVGSGKRTLLKQVSTLLVQEYPI